MKIKSYDEFVNESKSIDFELNEAVNTADDLVNFINKESKHFASFLKPKKLTAVANGDVATIKPASGSFTITVDFGNSTIDTTGKPEYPESVSYVEILEYCKITKFKIISESVDLNESTTLAFSVDDHINHIYNIFTKLKNKAVDRDQKKAIADAIALVDRFDAKIAELSDSIGMLNESSLNEMTERSFQPDILNRSTEIDHKMFKKLMPRTEATSDSATSHIMSFEGNTMFVHYQYHIVKPNGNQPDRPTYRIHQSQYWLNDAQLKMQNRVGEKVNVTLLTIFDITDPKKEIKMGAIYVDTDEFLDEMKRVFQVEEKQS